MRDLRVIIKRQNPDQPRAWYNAHVGQSFRVYRSTRNYIVKEDYDRGHDACWRHIDFSDADEIVLLESELPAPGRWLESEEELDGV